MSYRLVRMSRELGDNFAARDMEGRRITFAWGEPDEAGIFTPILTLHEPPELAEAQARLALLEPVVADAKIVAEQCRAVLEIQDTLTTYEHALIATVDALLAHEAKED